VGRWRENARDSLEKQLVRLEKLAETNRKSMAFGLADRPAVVDSD